ncbi:hypothetical protein LEN26_019557 [Aphanomyces euteiches]|nr:hypothetical protein LEN26_019557 [Aphanomyces euteiches]
MEVEEQLVRWILDMREDGVPVTHHMLQMMALDAAIDLELRDHEFLASWHWMNGFKQRHGLSLRSHTRVGQDTPDDGLETLKTFAERVRHLVCENGIGRIYNADQTGVNYEYLPTKTLNVKGDKTVWVKCGGKTTERVTAMVKADSAGKRYPLFLVLRTAKSKLQALVQENLEERQGFGKTMWKSVKQMQDYNNCETFGNPTAWWNS